MAVQEYPLSEFSLVSRRPKHDAPIVATLAVVVRAGTVLLVRRANPPDAGFWGFPGGKIEAGETIREAAVRELYEETGVIADTAKVLSALDAFDRDDVGALRHHYVLIPVLCAWASGEPVAQDDALEARWFDLADLEGGTVPLSIDVAELARKAAAMGAANR